MAPTPPQVCTHLHQDPEQLLPDSEGGEGFVWKRADPLFNGRHHSAVDERLLQVLSEGQTAPQNKAQTAASLYFIYGFLPTLKMVIKYVSICASQIIVNPLVSFTAETSSQLIN